MFPNYSRFKFIAGTATVACLSAFVIMACSGGDSADGASTAAALTVSGGFSGVTMMNLTAQQAGELHAAAATEYTMICSILVDPFTSGHSDLSSDGSFSLSIAGGSGKPIGCMLTKSGALIAAVQFTTTESSMTGSAEGGSGLSVNDGATAIQFPTNLTISNGAIAVSQSDITQNSSTAPTVTWADPSGTWSIDGVCSTEISNTTGQPVTSCEGAQSGDVPTSVYLNQLQATHTTNGTRTGLSVWRDSAARAACGNKEGVKIDSGWTATGGWDGDFTNGVSGSSSKLDLSDTTKLATAAGKAKVRMYNSQAVCGKTLKTGGAAIVDGTTTCEEVDWGTGGWGMGADACKLYCVMGALNEGGDTSYYDWGTGCKKRYRAHWENNNELSSDTDYNGGNGTTAGKFSAGTCSDTSVDGCKDTTSGKVLFELDKALDQFMIGELFITGNVGTLMEKRHFTSNFPNANRDGTISCGGTHIEKMTMTQSSSTKSTVIVEHSFVADSSNAADCATNSDFLNNQNEKSSMILKLTKQ